MSTITREQLRERARQKVKSLELAVTQTAFADSRAELEEELELARIALASLETEPAIHRWRRVTVDPYGPYPWHYGNFIGFSKPVEGIEDEYFYSSPPAPVVPDDVMAAIQKVARIRLDLNDFDGDRRGIAESLGEAEEALIEVVNRRAAMLQGAETSKMSGIMPDYEGGVMTQREFFQAGWEAHHAAMLRAGGPVQFGWSKGHFGYHTLFNAICKAVNIQGGALSISVSAFEDAMLAAAPQQEEAAKPKK